MVEANSAMASSGRHCGHTGKQLTRLREYCRFGRGMHHLQRRRQGKEHKPQRRRQVGHHAGKEHRPVNRVHPLTRNRRKFIRLP